MTPARGLVATGGDVNLTCTTEAGPMNMFQWRHVLSNTMLTAVLSTDMMSVLTVSNATAMDQGMYVCTASNEAGNYSQTAVVVGETELYGSHALGIDEAEYEFLFVLRAMLTVFLYNSVTKHNI